MEVLIWELIVKAVRYPGAMFLSLITKHDLSYWLDRGSIYGLFLLGSALIALFLMVASWASS